MRVPVVVDHTSSGKQHFEVLDGLRGSAAFLIVIFHVFNYSFGFHGPWALVKHAYLAVDFFVALAGFVVAYASHSVHKRACRLLVDETPKSGRKAGMDFSTYPIREFCLLARPEVLRRARPLLAEPELPDQAGDCKCSRRVR